MVGEHTGRRRRAAWRWGGLAIVLLSGGTSVAAATPIFELADASDVIFRATVAAAETVADGKLRIYTLHPQQMLKGALDSDRQVTLVQELLFKSTRPYFEAGATPLVFAVPFPGYSAYRAVLPGGGDASLRWTARLDSAADLADLVDPRLTVPVERYLAVRDDPAATAQLLAAQLSGASPRLRRDALAAIEARPELGPLLDGALLDGLAEFFADERVPVAGRGAVLVRLGRVRAPGLVALAEGVLDREPALRAAAVDALVNLGRLPDETRLLGYSRAADAALRVAAVRGLARLASPAAFDRLQKVLADDPADSVHLAALGALGDVDDRRAIGLLSHALRGSDRARVYAASDALGRLGSEAAIAVLAVALIEGAPHASTAAAFALMQTGELSAVRILLEQKEKHPDPNVRRACTMALGQAVPHVH